MNLAAAQFPDDILAVAGVLAAVLLVRAAWRIPWLTQTQHALTGWFGATVVVLGMWQLKASIQPGLSFHLLGATALTLIAGRDRALLSIAAILAGEAAYAHGEWASLGLNWLVCSTPVWITVLLLRLSRARMPANYFVYIFFNAFAAGAIGMWLTGLVTCVLLGTAGAYPFSFLLEEQLPYYFLMGWPEAFSTGLNLSILVVYRPQWVTTFDDDFYLR
ncbi:Uncharacterized membrane protein [Andreprevotia lacus DSM 23236]|jgi:uncharacterized membrane protein|uniref:Uncharacterized membrane protein n=1 Tax=Andreprevotia lacus DSM 23236 TaxID=1121001 RepID=A0A1W1XYA0_9NEIS|nr:energy-coupling factor ABC transporter permease [Andreprevotia lacus]SMC28893.1 Uncharacterized membrane protein [Andreprevotia lacus DSM 23236]